MRIVRRRFRCSAVWVGVVLALGAFVAASPADGIERYVAVNGADSADGLSWKTAFRTIQKGVDALQSGDTLTIGPGEYFENVSRTNLGSAVVDTVIRSDVPGMSVLRGDVPAPDFKKVDGYRFVYAAPFDREPIAILEHTGLQTLFPKPNVAELEFNPGHFHYDTNSRTLYISNRDLAPPDQRRYTVAVSKRNGVHLTHPRRVRIEGLAAAGFQPAWGINLDAPVSCVVRDCVLFMNVGGIRMGPGEHMGDFGGGSNVIERCEAFGNTFGGIVRYGANHDVIRNCHTYRNVREGNEHFGIMHYTYMTGPLVISNNVSWGQNFDYSVKPGHQQEKIANNVGLGYIRNANMVQNLIGGGNEYDRDGSRTSADNILFVREPKLDRDFEFADPLNLDYRLQPDSRFRKTAPDGKDRGPYPYAANVFYLSPVGDDQADGLSMRQPWRTLERAFKALRAGDTLYLAEGEYAAASWTRAGDGMSPIRIGGRGRGMVAIKGKLILAGGAGIVAERLHCPDGVELLDCRDVAFMNCTFAGATATLNAYKVKGLKVEHSLFTGVPMELKRSEAVTLIGNLYANGATPAVRVDSAETVRYSDYNSYPGMKLCWEVGRTSWTFADLRQHHDRYSRIITPEVELDRGIPRLKNAWRFESLGPHSTTVGPHHDYEIVTGGVDLVGPFLHSACDTTANLEWWSSHPANYTAAWGDTPEMTNARLSLKGLERFNTYSLAGLVPGRTYHFEIRSAEAITGEGAQKLPVLKPAQARVSFTTAASPAAPKVYHVALDGKDSNSGLSRQEAFRTVNRAAIRVRPGDTVMIGGGEYAETVRIRAAGTRDRPITFRSMPGEKVVFKGENVSLVFQIIAKPDIRLDGLGFGAGFWDKVIVVRQSPRLQVTRCLNAMIGADECPGTVVRNCVIRGGWSGLGLSRSPDSIVENNVFIMTILRHLTCDSPAIVRNNIFCECIRNKAHQTLLELSGSVTESNNCFYVRWPEDEKLAINWRPLTEYRARTGSDSFAANPMMPGTPGWQQGWQQSRVDDFSDCLAANPELVRRGIGLQPEALREFLVGVTNWPCNRAWAEGISARTNAASALARAGRDAEALTAYTNLAASLTMSDRLKAAVLEQAVLCAGRLKDYDRAMQVAKAIPVEAIAMRHQMRLLLDRGRYAELLDSFNSRKLGGRSFHQSYSYPELEDVMADLYYYRSLAFVQSNDLAAAEADLKVMNDKRMQLTYRSGESIHDLAWLRLGDFYRDQLKDEDRAYSAYTNILDRTTWTYWGRPRKPAARGADETLVLATKAVSEILRKRGRQAEIPQLEFNLRMAKAEAAAALLQTNLMLARFQEALAMPEKITTAMAASVARLQALAPDDRSKAVGGVGALVSGLTDDTRSLLLKAAVGPEADRRQTAISALLMFAPTDKVKEMLDATEKEARERAVRARLEPTLQQLRELARAQKWQELTDTFKGADFASWEEQAYAAEAFLLRGQAYAALKVGPETERDLKQAILLQPGNEMALFTLAQNYETTLSDPPKALETYLRLHAIKGVDYGWLAIATALNCAALLQKSGRKEEARKILEKFDPNKAAGSWRNQLTEALKSLGE